MVNSEAEAGYLSELLVNKNSSITDKSLTLMYHLMRNQIFWDGNKRTATLVANKLMIDNGAGLISVPLDKWPEWNNLIAKYYMTNDISKLKHWTYENGIEVHI